MCATFKTLLRCSAWATLLVALEARAAEPPLRPFDATYEVHYKIFSGGTLQFSFRNGESANEYVYAVTAKPSLLGRVAVKPNARQSSVMRIVDGRVLPQHYLAEDGRKDSAEDSDLRFDWSTHRLLGIAQSTALDEHIEIGWHDYLSSQIATLVALSAGEEPGTLHVLDGKQVRAIRYTREGTGKRAYNGKEIEVLLLRSEGVEDPSLRVHSYWHAPELSFLPVAVERSRKGKVDLRLSLLNVKYVD